MFLLECSRYTALKLPNDIMANTDLRAVKSISPSFVGILIDLYRNEIEMQTHRDTDGPTEGIKFSKIGTQKLSVHVVN